ncbi:hypothetical protein EG328_003068 [Venturia inaequalis]|uniref:Pyruvate decarboxylase n=1 Tax=Venturia inaequalis TaxID=5025 RepID=A0A8H3VE32_VENIN|nr:hypothetical protein EG328_003068 [Venturia inaequalis]KAE9993849.1 hypothetical protein EG327_002756 [Venturia inaequalis]
MDQPTNGDTAQDQITLGFYLWTRIKQIGVSTIFGVPGDFNLELLDDIYKIPSLSFIGSSNELNAAYSADGYGRVKEGVPGVFITTHGVGEMSAINGVLGSLCERVKVIHVVGQTSRPLQENKMMIHHSIGNTAEGKAPDHSMYARMSKEARVDQAMLWDVESAPGEIDRVIRECIIQSAPVYIFLPLDLSQDKVSKSLLDKPIDLSIHVDEKAQNAAITAILDALSAAQSPSLLVDSLAHKHGARQETRALAKKLQIPTYTSGMGKGILDETEPYFVGMYSGSSISDKWIVAAMESSDCTITIGSVNADTNTGFFARKFNENIEINPTNVVVKGKKFEGTFIKPLIAALTERLSSIKVKVTEPAKEPEHPLPVDHESKNLTQSWIWDQFEKFVRPGDVLLAETGTSGFGIVYSKLPKDVRFSTQTYYGSIGWATPATLGTEVALKELHEETGAPRGRTILFTGDGSMQLTMQEIGTMVTYGFKPILVVLNNQGYTIERVIHGARQAYNNINLAKYEHMLPFFGHANAAKCYRKVQTKEEFEKKVLGDEELKDPKEVQVVELVLDAFDVPWRLAKIISMRGPESVEKLSKEGFVGPGRVGIGDR